MAHFFFLLGPLTGVAAGLLLSHAGDAHAALWGVAAALFMFLPAVLLAERRFPADGVHVCPCPPGRHDRPLLRHLRLARLLVALFAGFFSAFLLTQSPPLAVLFGWFALAHLLAAVTGYPGSPELGALPSLLLRRWVWTGRGIWCDLDPLVVIEPDAQKS